jgi:hypothetical protein
MSERDELPPLTARNERDRENMEAWVTRKLEDIDDALLASLNAAAAGNEENERRLTEFLESDEAEIHAAERGNIEPLRAKYPQLARFLHLPKRSGKGDKFPPRKDYIASGYEMPDGEVVDGNNLTFACADVPVIRALWKMHFNRRPKGYATPEEIAAHRWSIENVEHVHWFLKSRKRVPDPNRERRLGLARTK